MKIKSRRLFFFCLALPLAQPCIGRGAEEMPADFFSVYSGADFECGGWGAEGTPAEFFCAFPGADPARDDRKEEDAPADATPGMLRRIEGRLTQLWRSPGYDIYVPFYAWHNRAMYDRQHTDRYNENPWGLGVGRSFVDKDGDWHTLYAMGFMDSYNKFEPIVGYGFLKNWHPFGADGLRLGAGYMVGITARENYDYIPVPLPLPMAGVGYKWFDVQAVYIPGTYNNGNVLFTWFRWSFGR